MLCTTRRSSFYSTCAWDLPPLHAILQASHIVSLMQVDRITSHWNGYITHGLGGTQQEAWDIFVRQTRLHELMGRPGFSLRFIRTAYSGAIDPDTALDW